MKVLESLTTDGKKISKIQFQSTEDKMLYSIMIKNTSENKLYLKIKAPLGTKILSKVPKQLEPFGDFILEFEQDMSISTETELEIIPSANEILTE